MMASSSPIAEAQNLGKLLQFLEQDSQLLSGAVKNGPNRERTELFQKPKQLNNFVIDRWSQYKNRIASDHLLLDHENGPRHRIRGFVGGTPITLEKAMELRMITSGTCLHSFSPEWRKSSLAFQHLDGKFAYGLQAQRCGSRGVLLCVQAYLIKHLIFDREYKSSLFAQNALQPNAFERRRAFVGALSEILWQVGDGRRCSVCLLQDESCFGPDHRYRPDRITEKLYIFEFNKLEDLQTFIKRNLDQFQAENGCGCILFLYSVILSRTFHKLREDMNSQDGGSSQLLTNTEECTQELINLLLTGRAGRHLHNGDMLYNNDGHLLSKPVVGIGSRSGVGFLFWDKTESDDKRIEVGSMLKTPKCPIWLTKINNQFGLLFSNNLDLVSDWRVEHRFFLHYYNGLLSPNKPTKLTIDTRYTRARPKTSLLRRHKSDQIPPLEQCIMTKWHGASIDWHGTVPFI